MLKVIVFSPVEKPGKIPVRENTKVVRHRVRRPDVPEGDHHFYPRQGSQGL